MSEEKRRGADRRRHPRGGRRPTDIAGYTPLVMIVDADSRRRDLSEAILAKLRFAVAPVETVEKAAAIVQALAPEIIVAGAQDALKLRDLALANGGIPIIAVGEETRVTKALIEEVRRTLRDRVPQT